MTKTLEWEEIQKGMYALEIMNKVYSFDPIIDTSSKVLILGTLPGAKSLTMKQYYADPKNQFWRIIYGSFGKASIDTEYEDKLKFLLERKVAIWDILRAAERKGSSDVDIKNGEANDVQGLLQEYPGVKRILLAGKKATQIYQKRFPNLAVESVSVPSTSPTPGRYVEPLDKKIQIWKAALIME